MRSLANGRWRSTRRTRNPQVLSVLRCKIHFTWFAIRGAQVCEYLLNVFNRLPKYWFQVSRSVLKSETPRCPDNYFAKPFPFRGRGLFGVRGWTSGVRDGRGRFDLARKLQEHATHRVEIRAVWARHLGLFLASDECGRQGSSFR